jgi:hypothetical protein
MDTKQAVKAKSSTSRTWRPCSRGESRVRLRTTSAAPAPSAVRLPALRVMQGGLGGTVRDHRMRPDAAAHAVPAADDTGPESADRPDRRRSRWADDAAHHEVLPVRRKGVGEGEPAVLAQPPYVWPQGLMEAARGSRKSRSGPAPRKGEAMAPEAPVDMHGTSRPVRFCRASGSAPISAMVRTSRRRSSRGCRRHRRCSRRTDRVPPAVDAETVTDTR